PHFVAPGLAVNLLLVGTIENPGQRAADTVRSGPGLRGGPRDGSGRRPLTHQRDECSISRAPFGVLQFPVALLQRSEGRGPGLELLTLRLDLCLNSSQLARLPPVMLKLPAGYQR